MAKLPSIPSISSLVPREISALLRPMREILTAFTSGDSQVATIGNLRRAGLIDSVNADGSFQASDAYDTTPPPAPTNLTAAGALANIMLSWDATAYNNLAYTEVWRAQTNDFSLAQLIGRGDGRIYVDNVGGAATRYYWIRYVSRANIPGPFNAQLGTLGETGTDPAYMLQLLLNKLGYDQFDSAAGVFPIRTETVLPVLPHAKYPIGVLVYLTTDGKLYRNVANVWSAAVAASDLTGQIVAAQIANAAITTAKFAAGIEPVTLLAALPNPAGYVGAKTVFLTTDGKLYRYVAGAWTSAVAASDMTGQLTNAQLADIASTKITGTLTNAQLDAIASTKITGTLTNAQLDAIAATKVTGQIVSTQITDDAITTAKLAAGAVTAAEIAANTIVAGNIAAGAITTAKLFAGAVTANEIAAGAVTAGKIAALSIVAGDLSAGAVIAGKIAAGAVTAGTIAALAVTATEIAAGAIVAGKIAAGAITANDIAADTITAGQIAVGAIGATEIAAGAITAIKIAAGTITSNEIAANTITAGDIAAGTISANELAANAITVGKIAAGAIVAGDGVISNLAIGTAHIIDGTMTNAKIGALAVDNAKIANLDAGKITAGYIDAARINVGSLDAKIANLGAAVITSGYINSARINTASIANATIGSAQVTGQLTAAQINVTSLSAISANVGLLRTATTGQRTEIDSNGIRVYDSTSTSGSTGLRVQLGIW